MQHGVCGGELPGMDQAQPASLGISQSSTDGRGAAYARECLG